MTKPSGQGTYPAPARIPATAGDVMRPALTAVAPNDHVAAAAYLMKRADATSIVVIDDEKARKPVGLITEADIVRAVADGKNLNEIRILALMTPDPAVIRTTAGIREAARIMVGGHFRHLPVTDDSGSLQGMADILDICDALLGSPAERASAS
jgi:CBS domain-containing protein